MVMFFTLDSMFNPDPSLELRQYLSLSLDSIIFDRAPHPKAYHRYGEERSAEQGLVEIMA